jgi:3-methyladenine DNA glycosylase AlkD
MAVRPKKTATKKTATKRAATKKSGTTKAGARKVGARKAALPVGSIEDQVKLALAVLEKAGTKKDRANLARFGITGSTADKAYGVSVANLHVLAKRLGRSHELAEALWETGWYEARMLAAFVGEPARVTPAQMERWCKAFDNWAVCDTVCFHLFDRTPHAWAKVHAWADRRPEFERRASFALLASLASHDKKAGDGPFLDSLDLIERAAGDDRNFVKKAVSWALRRIGRRSTALHAASVDLGRRLAESTAPAARWVGRDAVRELTSAPVLRTLAARDAD